MKRLISLLPLILFCSLRPPSLPAQQGQSVQPDLVREQKDLASCKHFDFKDVSKCAETLFTGTPFRLAIGSLAPQNGIGIGMGFAEVWHPTFCPSAIDFTPAPPPNTKNPCHWALQYNADGQATPSGSWRIGAYAEASHLSARVPHVHHPGEPVPCRYPPTFTEPSPLLDLYYQTTSLNRIYFYGLGPNTLPSNRAAFGLTESVVGLSTILPVRSCLLDRIGVSLLAEINGRFPSLRGNYGDSSPSIETLYAESTAPGLSSQPSVVQFGEGIRFVPTLPYNHFRINYLLNFQQFVVPATSRYSFRRLTVDLNHQIPLYGTRTNKMNIQPGVSTTHAATLSPVYVPLSPGGLPSVSKTKDFTGSVSFRLLFVESQAKAGSAVPFYFDPTIGGSDLNNQAMLPSYPDYRFRAPNLLLMRGSFEQALGKLPLGLFFSIDAAKSGLSRNDVNFSDLTRSYSAGLTLHAGGIPVVYLLFAWGGNEGTHFTGAISNALLGASNRPSLF